jgi:hypothetical protein
MTLSNTRVPVQRQESYLIVRFLVCFTVSLLTAAAPGASQQAPDRVRLSLDTTEAGSVLAILAKDNSRDPVSDADWRRLFATPGYIRLKARETAMGRTFTDDEFKAFVLSDTLAGRSGALRRALKDWAVTDMRDAAQRALSYLPEEARIVATVYVMIKPRTNSFVWDVQTDPAIFLYLDPTVTQAQFANTVAHELHHIGLSSVAGRADSAIAGLSSEAGMVAQWIGAFGEGFAMLAAAGGPEVHPHRVSADSDRTRWDHDVAQFNRDLGTLDRFFASILDGRLATADTVQTIAFTFYGVQGPWYTVGWKMAVTIERQFGRPELIRCMTDPHRLLERYNTAAADYNRTHPDTLARWSDPVLQALKENNPGGTSVAP